MMRIRALLLAAAVSLGFSFVSPAGASRPVTAVSRSTAPALVDVKPFGNVHYVGSTDSNTFNQPIVGMTATNSTRGYWEVASDGGVFTFGDAQFYGSMGATHLNAPIVGIAATPSAKGYWLAASDGGVFAFGDAKYLGSMGGVALNAPIVGISAMPTEMGNGVRRTGYHLVASDGGVFSFGNASFHGSMGGAPLNQPVVGMATTPAGRGYWLVGRDGGVFTFGDAGFFGSMGGTSGDQSIAGIATVGSFGYWLADVDGRVFPFGDSQNLPAFDRSSLSLPVVGIAPDRVHGQGFWLVGRGANLVRPEDVSEPGCAPDLSQRAVRPASFVLACGDGNSRIDNARWSVWSADHASGIGSLTQNDCVPSCAAGHFRSQTVDLRLDQPVIFRGHLVFSRLIVHLHGPLAPYTTTTVTFTLT